MKRARKNVPPPPESGLRKMSRRGFITSGATVSAAAAGVVIGGPLLHLGAAGGVPTADLGAAVAARKNSGPVVAYIHDPTKGELELLVGNTGVTVTDRDLVARLVRAAG